MTETCLKNRRVSYTQVSTNGQPPSAQGVFTLSGSRRRGRIIDALGGTEKCRIALPVRPTPPLQFGSSWPAAVPVHPQLPRLPKARPKMDDLRLQ